MLQRPYRCVALLVLLALAACTPKPDAAYLEQVGRARGLIDIYTGHGTGIDEARTIALQLIERQPKIALAYVEAARATMQGGQISGGKFAPNTRETAEKFVRQAIALDANYCEAHAVLGHVLYREQRYADGLLALDEADRIGCDYPWRHVNRGRILIELQRYDEAAAAFAKVPTAPASEVNRRGAYREALSGRIWLAYRAGDAKAMHDLALENVALADDNDAWARGNGADNLTRAGDFAAAIAQAHAALERMDYGVGRRNLATALYGQSLWLSSRADGAAKADEVAALEKEAAALDVDFESSGKTLWGSLANRDEAFRAALQHRLQAAMEAKP